MAAIANVMDEHNAKRCITLHNRNSRAAFFQKCTKLAYQEQNVDIECDIVDGTSLSTARRREVLNNFLEDQKRIASCARCLGEGVDVPSLEIVCLRSSKQHQCIIHRAAIHPTSSPPPRQQPSIQRAATHPASSHASSEEPSIPRAAMRQGS